MRRKRLILANATEVSIQLPPRSPKLNGYVERANGNHRQEFYETTAEDLNRDYRGGSPVSYGVNQDSALQSRAPVRYDAASPENPAGAATWPPRRTTPLS